MIAFEEKPADRPYSAGIGSTQLYRCQRDIIIYNIILRSIVKSSALRKAGFSPPIRVLCKQNWPRR